MAAVRAFNEATLNEGGARRTHGGSGEGDVELEAAFWARDYPLSGSGHLPPVYSYQTDLFELIESPGSLEDVVLG